MTNEEVKEEHRMRGKIITLLSAEHDIWILCDVNGNRDESTLADEEKIKMGWLRKQYDGSDRLIDPYLFESSNIQPQTSFEDTGRRLDREL